MVEKQLIYIRYKNYVTLILCIDYLALTSENNIRWIH